MTFIDREFMKRLFIAGAVVIIPLMTTLAVVLYAQDPQRFLTAVEIHRGRLLIGTGATGFIEFDGATADSNTTTLTLVDPTADRTITLPNATGTVVVGVAAESRVDAGTVVLDGSNPTSIATGLSAIIACTVQDVTSTAPGDDPNSFTVITTGTAGQLDIYAWKNASGTDPTQVASTDSNNLINFVCVGTP